MVRRSLLLRGTVTVAVFCLGMLMLKPNPSLAATINVPGNYASIQAGVNAAANGDTVLVADGTYLENINFNGKAITVKSVNGAGKTIIDGNKNGSVVTFANGETNSAILSGFTIKNGSGAYSSRWAAYVGGGIYCANSSSPTITNCTISSNLGGECGGGIYCCSSSLTITNCTISGNSAGSGGGIYCDWYSSPTITNCTISSNSAGEYGGGISCNSSSPIITNCTISGNSSRNAGGILCAYSSSPTVSNCILWGDTAIGYPSEINLWYGSITVTYSDIQGDFAGVHGFPGTGNISADPLFVNAATGNFHLQAGSPCIDAGIASGAPTTDINGNPRPDIAGTNPDMGAYEYRQAKITPTITWSNPADIIYGTPLGSDQLNATASVTGTFTYNPPAGTVLNPGSGQTLSVTFTPTDTADYNSATASVTINVDYGFSGLLSPYSADKAYKIQSAIPLIWQYTNNTGTAVDTSNANPVVELSGPYANNAPVDPNDIIYIADTGNSGYRYDSTTYTWQYNWKTTGLAAGIYYIRVSCPQTGQVSDWYAVTLVTK